ncbi:MobF family relaxase [Nocardia veterana]|uniref:Relaxase domain-containing protein n=1 Tax=Nocardia veterana TaxID=132249 RepID=A0A7X6LXU9_9NOCA|nr:MobF family relaxase [Nocardia veterana]NKY86548.1 relaxase domain-containing protein [Nocardia veterana]
MTATLHKILAGDSYRYYLRQVAAADATDRGPATLSDYYSAHGEQPGTWWGNGLAALDLSPGDEVTEAQMRALFGHGRHPDADAITARVIASETAKGTSLKAAKENAERATRLGSPYRTYSGDNEFRKRCGKAFAEHNIAAGVDARAAIPDDVRARIRTDVATEMFTEHYERPPLDDRELSGFVTKTSRPKSAAVAGFDLTFSPVKSVSALWAIAPLKVSERIAAAHDAAVDDALRWLQKHGIFTRAGRNGVRQLDVDGIIAARFVHRESRCGDPDLHTHVVIANRVRGADGRWRTLDAAQIYRLNVTISEIYNTRLEHHLRADLRVEFAERAGTNPNKRPIREIVGIPEAVIRYWSRRDTAIRRRLGELTVEFHQQLGREPTAAEMWNLSQVATLQTRPAKHLSRSWAEQRRDWRTQASTVLGGHTILDQVVATSINRASPPSPMLGEDRVADIAREVVEVVSGQRSVWQHHHIRAETERRIRALTDRDTWADIADAVVAHALSPRNSLARQDRDIAAEPDLATVPAPLQRRDGASVYTHSGTQTYTSAHQLDIEYRLTELALQPGARSIDERFVTAAIAAYNTDAAHEGKKLNAGQAAMVTHFATFAARIAVASAPAGTGKTTAMRVLVDAWHASGGTVLGLAPEAAPAAILAEATGARVETVDRLLHILDRHRPRNGSETARPADDFPASVPMWVHQIDELTLVIVDEHIKLSDRKRLRLFEFLTARGATVRCVGDDKQLPSIDAGGAGIDGTQAPDAITLTHVVRFADTAEATAGLALREGDPSGLGYYLDHQRIHSGSTATVADKAYGAWFADRHTGRDAIMLAPTHDIVTDLNNRARSDRLARTTETASATTVLGDGLSVSAGDIVCTRRNNRRLALGERDWVRNGYRWRVDTVHADGSLTVTHLRPGGRPGAATVLPPEYVGLHVRLGYAMTIDSAQGTTADTCHAVLTGSESRNQLYVAITRGIHANHLYVPTTVDGSEASFWTEPAILPRTAVEVLQHILAREATHTSAHTALRDALDPHRRLGRGVDIYLDAIGVATEHTLGPDALTQLDHDTETLLPGLTDAPAYPTLRQHLAILALAGHNPVTALRAAIGDRELDTAKDPAAVLDWRLDTSGAHSTGTGPLPWLLGLPDRLSDPALAGELDARRRIVADLATQITTEARTWTAATAPVWARPLLGNRELIADLAVWRAANHVPDTDLRPTGPGRFPTREREHLTRLTARVTNALDDLQTATHTWEPLVKRLDTRITSDPWWPVLADYLDTAAAAGLDIDTLLTDAAATRALPDDMPAAALWSRLRLDPSALATPAGPPLRPDWIAHLHDIVGHDLAEHVITDPAWPRLVAAIDTAPADWTPHDLLATAHELLLTASDHATTLPRANQLATALAWRIEILTHPASESENPHPATETATAMTPPTPEPHDTSPDHADSAGPVPAEIVHAIGDLASSGRIDDARQTFTRLTAHLDNTERDLLQRVITTLTTRAYPVAAARLRWAADRYPKHRAFILAAIPTTDPHLHQPPDNPPPSPDPRTAAHDHREYVNPARRRPPRPDAGRDAYDTYTQSFADLDTNPTHLPVPEGTGATRHRPGKDASDRSDTTSFLAGTSHTVDYDRYAVPDHDKLSCVACGLERARTDPHQHHYDDGLCSTCRDDNQPGIPDHDPTDHVAARCTFITAQQPPNAALALLRKDWRHTRNPADRATIETFADALMTAETPASQNNASQDLGSDRGFDPSNPTHVLTDTELIQAIGTLELRIQLADDKATIYGPARAATEHAGDPDDAGWLKEELSDLQAERTRRAHLTPEQTTTEDTQRANRENGIEHRPALEHTGLDTSAAADTDGPEL